MFILFCRELAELHEFPEILEVLDETESEITCSQLDSTISNNSSINSESILLNPHPRILQDVKKMELLRKWEKWFKNSDCRSNIRVESKSADLNPNLTHFLVDEEDGVCSNDENGDYCVPYYEALLSGAWIIKFEWVKTCCKKGQIVEEDSFVVCINWDI